MSHKIHFLFSHYHHLCKIQEGKRADLGMFDSIRLYYFGDLSGAFTMAIQIVN